MLENGIKKIKDLNLFGTKNIHITGNAVGPLNEFTRFKKQDIHQSIAGYFEKLVRKYPQNTAVKTKNQELNYRQLNEESNQAARTILDLCGQNSGGAALLFEHDADMIVGIMSVLKAGMFYIPLDPTTPSERLIYILKDTGAKILLTNNKNIELARDLVTKTANHIKIINSNTIDPGISPQNPGLKIDPHNPAYILYTSGSTGRAKGVIQAHINVLHHSRVYTNNLHITASDRLTLLSSYVFDAAVMDIFGALLNGAALYPFSIMDEGNLDGVFAWLKEEKLTIYHSVPTVYRYLMDILDTNGKAESTAGETFPYLRFIVLGGESVYKKDLENYKKHFSRECLFINGLGPTESTVTLQYFIDKDMAVDSESVPVGFPVDETRVLLLTKNNREAQIYKPGEIVYKSKHLALGYANMPEKTAEVFVADPLTGTGRVFRTGDFGKRLEDGNIEFLGRRDFQVKIRGYRVELGEVESILDQVTGIKKSVVTCCQDNNGEYYLAAYYTCERQESVHQNDLHRISEQLLPHYMLPRVFLKLEEFLLTPGGKIDRKRLPPPDISLLAPADQNTPPQTDLQERIAEMWSQMLGIEKSAISIDHDFFELGGNSLTLIKLLSKLYKEFDSKMSITQLYRNPTIKEISKHLDATKYAEESVVLFNQLKKKKLFCFPPAGAYGLSFKNLIHFIEDYSIYGFNFIEDEDRLKKYVDIITNAQPDGPYTLLGWSAAGKLVFDVTRALENDGFAVADIILLDCYFHIREGEYVYYEGGIIKDMEEVLKEWGLHFLKDSVRRKVDKYLRYNHYLVNLEVINADVHLITSEDARSSQGVDFKCWNKLTNKTVVTYEGFGRHEEMLKPGSVNLKKNAELIKAILNNTKPWSTKQETNEKFKKIEI
jgi:amino acid adenylation domain-containing protein